MSHRIEFLSSAEREFLRLSSGVRIRIAPRSDAPAENPRPPGCIKLSGEKNLWRIRAGDYRILYSISDGLKIVAIIRVAHRRDSCR